jgi:hypothetical protein
MVQKPLHRECFTLSGYRASKLTVPEPCVYNRVKNRRRHDNTVEIERTRERGEDKESLKILMN